MTDKRITEIDDASGIDNTDLGVMVDVSDTTDGPDGTTKSFTFAQLVNFFQSFFGSAGSSRQIQFSGGDGAFAADPGLTIDESGGLNVGIDDDAHEKARISPGDVTLYDGDLETIVVLSNAVPSIFELGARSGKNVHFKAEVANTVSSGEATINWGEGNKQSLTLDDDCTVTFANPPGPTSLILRVIQDETSGRIVTWPENILWPDGTEPTLSTDADAIDIISFYFDGASYYGSYTLGFAVPL